VSPIGVDIDSPAFNCAGLLVSLRGDLPEIFETLLMNAPERIGACFTSASRGTARDQT